MRCCFLGTRSTATSADLENIAQTWEAHRRSTARWQPVCIVSEPLNRLSPPTSSHTATGRVWRAGPVQTGGVVSILLRPPPSSWRFSCSSQIQAACKNGYCILGIALVSGKFRLVLSQWHSLLWLFAVSKDLCSEALFLALRWGSMQETGKYFPLRSL